MKGSWNLGMAALAMVVICTAGVFAQCDTAEPGTPGDGCPDLRYDPTSGLMTFNADGAQVQSLLIQGPDPGVAGLLNPDGNWPSQASIVGLNWTVVNAAATPLRVLTGTYSYFANRYQNIMFTDTGNTGWNNMDDLAIIQYPAGLTQMDFPGGRMGVEMSTWDSDPNVPPPSTTIFTGVVVPEPAALSLLGIALLAVGAIRRR